MEKAPRSARPVQNLAWAHYEQTGQIEKAIAFYKRATTLEDNKKNFRFYSYNNLANIYFSQRQDHQKALFFARNALKLVPNKISTNVLYCKILAKTGNYDEAISHLNTLMEQDPYISDYPYIKGFLLLKKKKPEKAFTFFKKSLDLSPDRWAYLKGIGLCLTHMGNFQRGYWFLNRALTFKPQNTDIIIGLVDNRLLAGSQTQAEKWVKTFVDMVGVLKVEHTLKAMKNDPTGTPFSDQLGLLVSKELKKHAKKYENRALELQRHFEPAK
jgi:tetratricopeptide (TPR) repeat protein